MLEVAEEHCAALDDFIKDNPILKPLQLGDLE
jgi:hypothetical protein